jgi:hypothetical protein
VKTRSLLSTSVFLSRNLVGNFLANLGLLAACPLKSLRNGRPVAHLDWLGTHCPKQRTSLFSFVGHRGPDGWNCASAQNADIIPGMETNIIGDDGQLRSVDYRNRG